jgi:hypothetical protein
MRIRCRDLQGHRDRRIGPLVPCRRHAPWRHIRSCITQQQNDSVIDAQLAMAVEQRQPGIVDDEVDHRMAAQRTVVKAIDAVTIGGACSSLP